MCIRDRGGQFLAHLGIAFGDAAAQIEVEAHGVLRRCALDPVSYTHLRAHETVLDLVCRLLLEKKKKPMTHSNTTS